MIAKILIVDETKNFHSTYTKILETLAEAHLYQDGLDFTKENLCSIINKMMYSHYLLFQSSPKDEPVLSEDQMPKIENFIYVNEEVNSFINKNNERSGIFYIWDIYYGIYNL